MLRLFCLMILAATAVYDAARLEIPAVSCALLLGTAVVCTSADQLVDNTAAAGAVWAVYASVRALCSRAGSDVPIGMGDIKLLSILALMLGASDCFRLFAVSGILSGIAAAVLLIFKRAEAKTQIAFAPFIAAAYALLLLEDIDVYIP
ncbi:MAG: hypothetical protein J5535_02810 [Firmicutes bacterium]|nr:hypothetical protein [Bacillota bacterium]